MNKYIYRTRRETWRLRRPTAPPRRSARPSEKGQANIILATGASQFEMLATSSSGQGVDWLKVVMFHLDEYIGLGPDHPASFRGI